MIHFLGNPGPRCGWSPQSGELPGCRYACLTQPAVSNMFRPRQPRASSALSDDRAVPAPVRTVLQRPICRAIWFLARRGRRRDMRLSPLRRPALWLRAGPRSGLSARDVRRLLLPHALLMSQLPLEAHAARSGDDRPHYLPVRSPPATGLHHSQTAPPVVPL